MGNLVGDAEEAARAGDEVAIAANGAQPGVTERAAEDPVKVSRGTVLAPANAGGGGALEFQGAGGGSNAWRVISRENRRRKNVRARVSRKEATGVLSQGTRTVGRVEKAQPRGVTRAVKRVAISHDRSERQRPT